MRLAVMLVGLVLSNVLYAQDAPKENDSHVIKGVGAALCSNYTEAVENKDEERFLFGGFVQGYVSALNESIRAVFDLAPWQNDTTLGTVIFNYCTNNPNQQFVFAVGRVLISFNSEVLTEPSPLKPLSGVKPPVLLREAVLESLIERLSRLGFEGLDPKLGYSQSVKEAIYQFQEQNDLERTGIPDQKTMLLMFVKDNEMRMQSPEKE